MLVNYGHYIIIIIIIIIIILIIIIIIIIIIIVLIFLNTYYEQSPLFPLRTVKQKEHTREVERENRATFARGRRFARSLECVLLARLSLNGKKAARSLREYSLIRPYNLLIVT